MTDVTIDVDFLVRSWKSGHSSDHPRAGDTFADWARSGLVESVSEALADVRPSVRAQRLNEIESHTALQTIRAEVRGELTQVGGHRQPVWERGWSQNLAQYRQTHDDRALIPGYFENSQYLRFSDELYSVEDPASEAILLAFLVDLVVGTLSRLYRSADIHEFGCGTGSHVRRLAQSDKLRRVVGYDWARASQEILKDVAETEGLPNLHGRHFDFFDVDYSVEVSPGDLVLTVAALEQTGAKFTPFIELLLAKKPGVVAHLEPVEELLDTRNELGELSRDYFRKRNYLSGLFDALVELEAAGQIEILHSGRSALGSLFIEGYSLIVWRPSPASKMLAAPSGTLADEEKEE